MSSFVVGGGLQRSRIAGLGDVYNAFDYRDIWYNLEAAKKAIAVHKAERDEFTNKILRIKAEDEARSEQVIMKDGIIVSVKFLDGVSMVKKASVNIVNGEKVEVTVS